MWLDAGDTGVEANTKDNASSTGCMWHMDRWLHQLINKHGVLATVTTTSAPAYIHSTANAIPWLVCRFSSSANDDELVVRWSISGSLFSIG